MRAVGSALLLVLLLTGCGVLGADPDGAASSAEPSAAPSSPPPGAEEELEPLEVPDQDPPPCADVRAGIDAFNNGDPERTVELFEDALPLAEEYVSDEPGRTADLLLEAVEYYVALPPEEYADALTGSPEFRRHQVVTLAVCRYDSAPGDPEQTDEAVPAQA